MPRAKEFLFTGKKINAELARELGLVNHVTSDDELIPAALAMANRLADGAQMAIRATKASLNKILRDTVNLNLDTSLAMEKECFFSDEHKSRVTSPLKGSRTDRPHITTMSRPAIARWNARFRTSPLVGILRAPASAP